MTGVIFEEMKGGGMLKKNIWYILNLFCFMQELILYIKV